MERTKLSLSRSCSESGSQASTDTDGSPERIVSVGDGHQVWLRSRKADREEKVSAEQQLIWFPFAAEGHGRAGDPSLCHLQQARAAGDREIPKASYVHGRTPPRAFDDISARQDPWPQQPIQPAGSLEADCTHHVWWDPASKNWSEGSELHALGKCRPCVWFWKQSGCKTGRSCSWCHLCPVGALNQERKHRRQSWRTGPVKQSRVSL